MHTLRKRIFLGYGAILSLIVVILCGSMVCIMELGRASDALLRNDYQSILATGYMLDALEQQDAAVLAALMASKKLEPPAVKKNETVFLQWLTRAKDSVDLPGEGELVESIEKNYVEYLTGIGNLFGNGGLDQEKAVGAYHEVVSPLFKLIRESLIRLREMNHTALDRASRGMHRLVSRATLAIAFIGSASVVVGLLFSLLLSRIISEPVAELNRAVSRIAAGDYEVQVPVRGRDELTRLASQFNVMAGKLRQFHAMNISQVIAEKQKGEAIIQSVDDGLVVADGDLVISDINPKALSIFGVKKEEAQGKPILEVVRDENLGQFLRQAVALRQAPKMREGEDILTVAGEGRQLHLQFSIIPMSTADPQVPWVILLLRDVTRLHELDRLKSEFVLTASHELRTPLVGIGMAINLVLEKALPKLADEEKELLWASHKEVRRLSALVKDLLDLSKIEAGKLEMAFEALAPARLCEQALASVRQQAQAKHIEAALQVPDDLPLVRADPVKIVWVLINLLANAVRHTHEGGRIELSAAMDGSQVRFAVRDDGEGVPYEDQSRIFDKFVQIDSKNNEEGTGLGLTISREIVRAHQGNIWLDSHPGEGSTFTFTLPLSRG